MDQALGQIIDFGCLSLSFRFNEWSVSAYITPSGAKFMLLHDTLNSDGIRHFFTDVRMDFVPDPAGTIGRFILSYQVTYIYLLLILVISTIGP